MPRILSRIEITNRRGRWPDTQGRCDPTSGSEVECGRVLTLVDGQGSRDSKFIENLLHNSVRYVLNQRALFSH